MASLPVSSTPSPPSGGPPVAEAAAEATAAVPAALQSGRSSALAEAPPPRLEPPALDGRQMFFLFVGSALAACLVFALGVMFGRRMEQRAVAQQKAAPADPLAVIDEIANAEEALTFHRTVLDHPPLERPTVERPVGPPAPPRPIGPPHPAAAHPPPPRPPAH